MENAADGRYGQMEELQMAERVTVEVVVERAQRMVVSHQPQLRYRITRRHVGADVAENILVAEQNRAEIIQTIELHNHTSLHPQK